MAAKVTVYLSHVVFVDVFLILYFCVSFFPIVCI